MSSAPSTKVHLGRVRCPSGVLVIVDLGLAQHWERRGVPAHRHEPSTDLVIEGPDAREAGLRYDRSYDPLALYDHRDPEGVSAHFAAFTREHGFDARATARERQVPHVERARRALDARGRGIGCVVYDGLWGVVAEVTRDRELEVVGIPMPEGEFEGRLRSIDILVAPDAEVATSQPVDGVMVDHGQLLCIDLDILDQHFHARRSLDGLADFVFWGRDAAALAAERQAPALESGQFGWLNVPVDDVGIHAGPLQESIKQGNLHVGVDYRPHCHVEAINRQVRADPRRAGEIAVAGEPVCGFDNRWGDGVFTVYRDLDAKGQVVRIRVDVGSDQRQRLMRRVAHRHQIAHVTRAIVDDAEPARFVDRHEPRGRRDSGWILSSGAEPEDEPDFVALPVTELVARYPELEPLLDEPVGARFTLRDDGSYRRET